MYFTSSHEWVQVEGNIGTVGITDYAQKELGEVVYIELPKKDLEIQAGEEVLVLESTKAAVDITSPLSGRVIAINESVKENPSLLNQTPESTAWLYQLQLSKPSELNHLMNRSQYLQSLNRMKFFP